MRSDPSHEVGPLRAQPAAWELKRSFSDRGVPGGAAVGGKEKSGREGPASAGVAVEAVFWGQGEHRPREQLLTQRVCSIVALA